MIIYKATNKITGKCYIGQTKQKLEKRIQNHLRDSEKNKKNQRPFLLSIKKHGIESFVFEEIDRANSTKDLDTKEIYWIEKLDTIIPNGYNILSGGQFKKKKNQKLLGKLISEGLKKSTKWAALKLDEEYQKKVKDNFISYFKGKKFTEEHKRKIWEKNKERVINFNRSTAKRWIVIDSKNKIERILSSEDYFSTIGLDTGRLSRMSSLLKNGKITKRYKGYYCVIDKGQTDEEIMKMVEECDNHCNIEYKVINRLTNEIKILMKEDVYSYCIEKGYDYSSFLRMLKGKFNSYKDWIIYVND